MKFLFSFCCLIFFFFAKADYLIVNRIANLREYYSTSSEILEKLNIGDTLLLVSDEQANGYYHVTSFASGQEGWVYRTLVRRLPGNLDSLMNEGLVDENGVVDVRVLDVGAGLCTLIKLPNNKFVVYDAGCQIPLNGDRTFAQIEEYIPVGSIIELMVLSHTDADHISAAGQVIKNYRVKKVIWGGYEASMISGDPSGAYTRLVTALENSPSTENVNLHEQHEDITPGQHFNIGTATFTFLCGFGEPPAEWNPLDKAEKLNSVSIVMKLEYSHNSILFCGDAVGRHRDDPEDALIATEKYMIDNAAQYLPSTIIIAPHHGAKNGSSTAFVDAVKPKKVIFSAGHKFHHPETRTANLYLRYVTTDDIYRTDRGDDEDGTEWNYTRINGCIDKYNDDNIQIQLRSNHTYRVFYLNPDGPCN